VGHGIQPAGEVQPLAGPSTLAQGGEMYRTNDAGRLAATETVYGWCVEDEHGGIWWPGDAARLQIEGSDLPGAEAVRLCLEEPMQGEWRS